MAYHHVRSLIYRPAVIANIGDKGSSAVVAVGDAAKHIIQIVQLLDERKLSFSLCLNRNEVLTLAGFGLLFQMLNLDRDGKLIKDCNRLVCSVMEMLERGSATGAIEFRRVGCSLISVPRADRVPMASLSRHNSEPNMAAHDSFRATTQSLKAIAARFSPTAQKASRADGSESRRATISSPAPGLSNGSSSSLSSIVSESSAPRSEPALSPLSHRASLSLYTKRRNLMQQQNASLDYMSFAVDPLANYAAGAQSTNKSEVSPADWERLLSSLDNGQTNIYDTIYGGPPVDALADVPPLSAGAETNLTWSPGVWNWNQFAEQAPTQSVLSFSDDSLSADEYHGYNDFPTAPGIMIPEMSPSTVGLGMDNSKFGL